MPSGCYIFVRHGRIRVSLTDRIGNKLILYRIIAGNSCVLTTATLLAEANYAALAVAETPVEVVLIPRAGFMKLLAESDSFRNAVLADHGDRLLGLMSSIGKLSFESIDSRLSQVLVQLAGTNTEVLKAWSKLEQLLRSAKARSAEALDQAITQLPPKISSANAQAWFRCRFSVYG
jgi:CRP/FNR family transcriptional regulator